MASVACWGLWAMLSHFVDSSHRGRSITGTPSRYHKPEQSTMASCILPFHGHARLSHIYVSFICPCAACILYRLSARIILHGISSVICNSAALTNKFAHIRNVTLSRSRSALASGFMAGNLYCADAASSGRSLMSSTILCRGEIADRG